MRALFSFLTLLVAPCLLAQNNPGFLGKRHALGFFAQTAPFHRENRYNVYHLRAEQTLSRTLTIQASAGFFSHTYNPLIEDYKLTFKKDNGAFYPTLFNVVDIDGKVTIKGKHFQVGLVKYIRKYGSVAPYGKFISLGCFYNSALLSEDNLIYQLKDNSSNRNENISYTTGKSEYKPKHLLGMYAEIGEKRVFKSAFFFQYSLQCNLPLALDYYAPEYSYYYNHQDYLEYTMRKIIIRNNVFTAYLGIGFLLK